GIGVLVHVHATEQLGRHVLPAQRAAAVGGEDVAPVELAAHLGQATHHDRAALALVAGDLHAADALQRLGDVVVRQLADVLGHDRVDDLVGGFLDDLGAGQAAAHAGDLDGVQVGGSVGLFLRVGGGGQRQGHAQGEQAATVAADIGGARRRPEPRAAVVVLGHAFPPRTRAVQAWTGS